MGVQIGTTVTSTRSIRTELTYVCSKCGRENRCRQTIEIRSEQNGPAYPSRKAEERMAASAHLGVQKKTVDMLRQLTQEDVSKRFSTAGFTCCCEHCGHREPWARMNYRWMEKPFIWLMTALLLAIICLIVLACYGEIEAGLPSCVPVALISLALLLAGREYQKRNTAKREAEIAALPASAIPQIQFLGK